MVFHIQPPFYDLDFDDITKQKACLRDRISVDALFSIVLETPSEVGDNSSVV